MALRSLTAIAPFSRRLRWQGDRTRLAHSGTTIRTAASASNEPSAHPGLDTETPYCAQRDRRSPGRRIGYKLRVSGRIHCAALPRQEAGRRSRTHTSSPLQEWRPQRGCHCPWCRHATRSLPRSPLLRQGFVVLASVSSSAALAQFENLIPPSSRGYVKALIFDVDDPSGSLQPFIRALSLLSASATRSRVPETPMPDQARTSASLVW